MGPRWLQYSTICWGAQPRSKWYLQSPRDHSFKPEPWMKTVYICFIYFIHIFLFIDWFKDFGKIIQRIYVWLHSLLRMQIVAARFAYSSILKCTLTRAKSMERVSRELCAAYANAHTRAYSNIPGAARMHAVRVRRCAAAPDRIFFP